MIGQTGRQTRDRDQTDKRQGSDRQTSQKEEIIWINKQTREKEKDQT